MKFLTAIFFVLPILALTASAQRSAPAPKPQCDSYVSERLDSYFIRQAVQAAQIINNADDQPNRSRTEIIKIGPHTVEWVVQNEGRESSVSVRINGDLITLNDKQSVNLANSDQRLSMNVVGEWHQVKLYKLHEREIIALTMRPAMCTGLMCSVGAQLYY